MILAWIALTFSLIGIALNANRYTLCWPIWLISNVCWIIVEVGNGHWPQVFLWTIFGIFNVYGWMRWRKHKE